MSLKRFRRAWIEANTSTEEFIAYLQIHNPDQVEAYKKEMAALDASYKRQKQYLHTLAAVLLTMYHIGKYYF